VWAIGASNVFTGIHNNLLMVVLQPFVVRVAGSVAALSLLQTFANRLGGIVGSLAQLAGGHLADRWGRRPIILLQSSFVLASLSLFLATAVTGTWTLLVPAFLFLGLGLLGSPAIQSTVAESVRTEERAMAYSKVLFALLLPAAAIAFVGGYLADVFGYPIVFAIGIAFEAVNLGLFALVLRETLEVRNGAAWSLRGAFRLGDSRLRAILLVTSLDSFSWTITLMIIYGVATQRFGFTNADIGIIVGIWAVVFAGATLPVGKLVERYGSRRMIVLSESLGIPVFLGWLFSTTTEGFALVSVVNGLAAATWVPAWQTLIANSVEDRVRAEVTGKLSAARGLLAFPAPLLGGFLFTTLGYEAPILASLVGVFVTLAFMVRLIHDPPKASAAT
jgi:DHA1 family multidrug resistance protein-like MFS transporter